MRVDIEKVFELQRQRMEYNSVPLKEMEFYKDGVRVEVSKDALEWWEFTGLNNTDFIIENFGEDGPITLTGIATGIIDD